MMKRVPLLVLLSVSLLSGCSVFGIATRSQLEESEKAAQARHDALRDQNRVLREELTAVRQRLERTQEQLQQTTEGLDTDLTRAREELGELWSHTGDLKVRLAGVEDQLASADDATEALRRDLDDAAVAAQDAAVRTERVQQGQRRMRDAWLRSLREERERLRDELLALERQLDEWESRLGDPAAPSPLEPGPAEREGEWVPTESSR